MHRLLPLGPLLVICFAHLPAATGAEPHGGFRPMPWHLVDLWWDVSAAKTFDSISVDVHIDRDLPADVNLYIAPLSNVYLGKTPFYGGLQTQADGHTKADRRLRKIGRGMLMSMWKERSLDAIRPSQGGLLQSSGHEGDFVSVRRPYPWTKGTYTFRVTRMDAQEINGKEFTWVGAFLRSHQRNETIFIGALRFPGKDLPLRPKFASFVEIYGRAIEPQKIPPAKIRLGKLQINGAAAKPKSVVAVYPQRVPDHAVAKGENGWVEIEIGPQAVKRETRQVRVLP